MSTTEDALEADVEGFCEALSRWATAEVDPLAIDRSGAIPKRHLEDLASLGAFGVTLPEAVGGSGLPLQAGCRVVETLARHDRSIATTVGLHLGLGTRGLVAFGTPAQRDRWLPELADGRRVAAFCATEPQAGSDLSTFATRAQLTPSGALRVRGQKIYVTNGGLAGTITVAVALAGPRLPAASSGLLVLDARDPGLTVGAEEKKLGLRGSSTTSLFLDDLEVESDRLLGGEPGHGPAHLAHVLGWGRILMAGGCTGTAAAALDLARDHVAERRQFRGPLLQQPVVREQLATMGARLFAMRAAFRHAALTASDTPAAERASMAAKIYCSEGSWDLCDLALQLHGGSGYIEETGIALLLRDTRVTRIFEGANDVLLTRLGTLELLSPPPEPGPGAAAAPPLEALAAGLAETLRAGRRLAALREPASLHRLGRLVVWREVGRAIAAHPDPRYPSALALLLGQRVSAELEAMARAHAFPPSEHGDAICDHLTGSAHP